MGRVPPWAAGSSGVRSTVPAASIPGMGTVAPGAALSGREAVAGMGAVAPGVSSGVRSTVPAGRWVTGEAGTVCPRRRRLVGAAPMAVTASSGVYLGF